MKPKGIFVLKETDMDKVYNIIEDLKKSFLVDVNVPDQEIIIDKKTCTCESNCDCEI